MKNYHVNSTNDWITTMNDYVSFFGTQDKEKNWINVEIQFDLNLKAAYEFNLNNIVLIYI